jgi:pimeloyl-ACP methyl ester carboxylesterase
VALARSTRPNARQHRRVRPKLCASKLCGEIFYKDWGNGQPIVFSHGWPLSANDWDTQMLFFLNQGYRVIAHDRRGHGRSTQTGENLRVRVVRKLHAGHRSIEVRVL